MKKVFAIGVIVALAFGVYYVAAFQHLSYDIDALRLDEVGVLSASVIVFLRVNNPNPLPLYLAATTFDLYINEDYAGHGSTEAATIGGYRYQRIHAPVTIFYTGLSATVVNSILSGGRITLDIRGDAHFFVRARVDLVENLFSRRIIWFWERMEQLSRFIRQHLKDPTQYDSLERLYYILKQREHEATNLA